MTEQVHALPLRVDIVSDVVCPWCIIGYKPVSYTHLRAHET